ncbi:IS66 family transposase [Sphingomonas sp. R1]|uniref:IS66 family transposase n=1 Tax=Sphingomonas sp. R1 TaxID=399176 RepID=UPI0022240282|nr:IS66 family transposase [Sphingomonas sp. R1]UYY76803.1 IS66 family transposase [Sphingomonas sp. R1]
MSSDALDIPDNPDAVKALLAAMQAKLAASEQALAAERSAHQETRQQLAAAENAIKLTTLQIEKLKVQLARLRRMKFGQSSERLLLLADQLELSLEDLEAAHAHATCVIAGRTAEEPASESNQPRRQPLPAHLRREEVLHPAPAADGCTSCGGAMARLGEDVTEVLEYVPGRFHVVRHVRPKLACKRCDAISQAPAPSLPVPRGRAGPGLLAHVVISKFADHLPLYRQSQIFAREGVEVSRSTLADWMGQVSWLLQPLVDRIAEHVMASSKLHADDTPVPVLSPGSGKTATGRLWVYVRDNRRWRPSDKPAALYRYSPDRKGERPREHLKTFAGFLQADAYAGFEKLYAADRQPGLITPVACWAHVRRKLHDVLDADARSIAREGLVLIGDLYEVERRITRDPHDDRREARKHSKLKALDFFQWADGVLAQVSARSPLAEALRYAVRLKPALLTYTEDGRLEIDNNLAENALRGIAVGRKNWLFAGADCGGERAATIYSLLETAKLNGINPQVWLADVLNRIGRGHPINRTDELLPWNWADPEASSFESA